MLRAVSSNLCPEHWTYEGELLAVLDMAGFLFSLGLRIFVAFGLLVCNPLLTRWRCLPPTSGFWALYTMLLLWCMQ